VFKIVALHIEMETAKVYIKTEEEDEEEKDAATQFLPEETPCTEPAKSVM
jgi:hypothetical protein